MAKPKISAKSAAADIKSGMDHAELMTKYGLSARGLEILFQKLIENHIVTETEISAIGHISAKSIQPEKSARIPSEFRVHHTQFPSGFLLVPEPLLVLLDP